jgi:predicted transcriptional regulator
MKDSNLRNFHVPLPEDLYGRLREEAGRTRKPATVLARYAIEDWLEQREKAELREAIAAYAAQRAGTEHDLNEDLEQASIEHLLAEEEKE